MPAESNQAAAENFPGMYSIKAVSQATGLTVETLRAWERRYRIVSPQRDDLGRRLYCPEDVLRLRRLREATERGHPIGRLVQMDDSGLVELLHQSGAATASVSAPSAFVARILEAAENYSTAACEQALTLAISLLSPAHLIDEVLEPLLRGESVTFKGVNFDVRDYMLRPADPYRARPRIYVGGESEPARALVADWGDVWFINGQPLADVKALIDDVGARHRRWDLRTRPPCR